MILKPMTMTTAVMIVLIVLVLLVLVWTTRRPIEIENFDAAIESRSV